MDPNLVLRIRDCRLLRGNAIVKEDLWIRNGKIINPEPLFFDEHRPADVEVYCPFLVSPGFIDTQINGAFGVDFTSCDARSIKPAVDLVRKQILRHGVTSFCPTVITSSPEIYHEIVPYIKRDRGGPHGAEIIGLHLEGPFINAEKKGAHRLEFVRAAIGTGSLESVYGTLQHTSIVTLAPELEGGMEAIEKLTGMGIVVSLGHSQADIAISQQAVCRGARSITHLFNAMPEFHHRDPGMVGLLAKSAPGCTSDIYYGVIADGIHTHPASLKIAYRARPEGAVVVTDAISAMGLPEGIHLLGGSKIHVTGERAVIAGTTTLCGSVATMDKCVRFFKAATDCSLVGALEAATLHPAKMLRIEQKKGTLVFDSDADFVVLDEELHVLATFIAGECVWQGDNFPSPVVPFSVGLAQKA